MRGEQEFEVFRRVLALESSDLEVVCAWPSFGEKKKLVRFGREGDEREMHLAAPFNLSLGIIAL